MKLGSFLESCSFVFLGILSCSWAISMCEPQRSNSPGMYTDVYSTCVRVRAQMNSIRN